MAPGIATLLDAADYHVPKNAANTLRQFGQSAAPAAVIFADKLTREEHTHWARGLLMMLGESVAPAIPQLGDALALGGSTCRLAAEVLARAGPSASQALP